MLAVATANGDEVAMDALNRLCSRYWQPVYAVIQSREQSVDSARELTQAFFVYLLEKSTLRRADRSRGRFRSFLLTVLWRFLRDERKREHADKRGGLNEPCTLEDVEDELVAEGNPLAEVLDREWALALMKRSLDDVQKEVVATRGEAVWTVLRRYLPGSTEVPPMSTAAAVLGISEAGARTEIHRLRHRCREILRKELLSTVSSPEELEEEIAYLGRALRSASAAIV